MLEDRREHIEREIASKKTIAARMYLEMVTDEYAKVNNQASYDHIRAEISTLEFDLKIINEILKDKK